MEPPPLGLRRRAVLVAAAAGVASLVLAGCSGGAPGAGSGAGAGSVPSTGAGSGPGAGPGAGASAGLPSQHIHAVARDPGDGKVYLATHEGLFRYDPTGPVRVGPVIDLMGFTVAGPGRFYASGHPGPGAGLSSPVGLIESRDGGQSWQTLSRAGRSDFHAMTASPAGVVGFDGVLRVSKDGRTWADGAIPGPPRSLAAAPDGSRVLATTAAGLLSSGDNGATWSPVPGAPLLLLVAWLDTRTVVGVSPSGSLHVSKDAAATWTTVPASVAGPAQALTAGMPGGQAEILLVTDAGILRSTDLGAKVAAYLPR